MRRYGKTYDKFVFGFAKCKIAPETANFTCSEATKNLSQNTRHILLISAFLQYVNCTS